MPADPKTCPHENLQASVGIARIQKSDDDPTIAGFTAEIRAWCLDCDDSFVFHGQGLAPGSIDPTRPTISLDGLELRAPCRPQHSDPSFGLGLTGISMRMREAEGTSSN